MKIKNITYSSQNNKFVLSARIVLNSGKKHDIYFEVDEAFKDFIAKDANPFLAASLAICMEKMEDLEIEGTVSKSLIANIPKIMKILTSWKQGFHPVLIKANYLTSELKTASNIGCFFSGGVDSFYTYLKNKTKIKYLIFVHGFDIKPEDLNLYEKVEKNIIEIARKENVKLITVKTNLRETLDQYFDWNMSYEFALGSVSLFLRNGFKEIYMSCGQTDINSDHRYMSPSLDILWSSENMKIIHYGCNADKIIKLSFLSNNKLVMKNLRVCWVNKNGAYNCCECEKCFRNMLALYVSDSLEKCKTFNKQLDLNKLKNTRVSPYVLKYFVALLKALKLKKDKSKVRFALEEFIKNNKYPSLQQRLKRKVRDSLRLLDNKYNQNRLYWFLTKRDLI